MEIPWEWLRAKVIAPIASLFSPRPAAAAIPEPLNRTRVRSEAALPAAAAAPPPAKRRRTSSSASAAASDTKLSASGRAAALRASTADVAAEHIGIAAAAASSVTATPAPPVRAVAATADAKPSAGAERVGVIERRCDPAAAAIDMTTEPPHCRRISEDDIKFLLVVGGGGGGGGGDASRRAPLTEADRERARVLGWVEAQRGSVASFAVERIKAAVDPALPRDEVLAQIGKLKLSRIDVRCLIGTNWLTDEVINFYFEMLKARQLSVERNRLGTQRTAYFFSTFFFSKLYMDRMQYDYSAVARWTRGIDLLRGYTMLLIPLHLGVHWAVAKVDLVRCRIVLYDSVDGDADYVRHSRSMLEPIAAYVADVSKASDGCEIDTAAWPLAVEADAPRQVNSFDCGMFVCAVAEHLSKGDALDFGQEDMPRLRCETILRFLGVGDGAVL